MLFSYRFTNIQKYFGFDKKCKSVNAFCRRKFPVFDRYQNKMISKWLCTKHILKEINGVKTGDIGG